MIIIVEIGVLGMVTTLTMEWSYTRLRFVECFIKDCIASLGTNVTFYTNAQFSS